MALNRIFMSCCFILAGLFSGFAYAEQPVKPAAMLSQTVQPVNINTADSSQLETLKGIGGAKAQAILDYRAQHGAFKSVEELAHVKGMGEKRLAQLQKSNPGRIVVQ